MFPSPRDEVLKAASADIVSFVFRAQSHAGMVKKDAPAGPAPAAAAATEEDDGKKDGADVKTTEAEE